MEGGKGSIGLLAATSTIIAMSTGSPNPSSKVGQIIRYYILPTTADEYINLEKKYNGDFKGTLKELSDDVKTIKTLYHEAHEKRQGTLKKIKSHRSDTEKSSALCDKKLVDEYLSDMETTEKIGKHLSTISQNLKQFKFYVETQALKEYAHYRGLCDWAQGIFPAIDYLSAALLTLSTIGAGLVYSTIFSASRGNIGLMSFTFPLFTVGFLIPGVIQLVLHRASDLSNEVSFASQAFWKAVIVVFMFFASIAVMVAITILNATIFLLKPGLPRDAGDTSEAPTDMVSSLPGIIVFAFSGTIFLLFLIGIGLSIVTRGPKEFMKLLTQSHEETPKLEEYRHA
ncbi:hypothetical protein BDQ17DRAFT_1439201 [Cyathus striatus]|nr:hypothetical protein BDQ17DRAFT_1439201 [Cyathus striatus]